MFSYHNHDTGPSHGPLELCTEFANRRWEKLVPLEGAEERTGFERARESSAFECPATAEMMTGTRGEVQVVCPIWEFLCTPVTVKTVRILKISLKPNFGLCQKFSLREKSPCEHPVYTIFFWIDTYIWLWTHYKLPALWQDCFRVLSLICVYISTWLLLCLFLSSVI